MMYVVEPSSVSIPKEKHDKDFTRAIRSSKREMSLNLEWSKKVTNQLRIRRMQNG